jgi:hypothetical protein
MQNNVVHATPKMHQHAKQLHDKEFSNFLGYEYDIVTTKDRFTSSSFD